VSFIKKIDFGWIYLLCGLALTGAAIVLPAHNDLEEIISKKATIVDNLKELSHRVDVHKMFLKDVQDGNPEILKRLVEMQLNQSPSGTTVVIDKSSLRTPLAWVEQRAKRTRVVPMEIEHASILARFATGQGRLWLLAVGAFSIFVGLISGQTRCKV
jgi:hypothetical protein|tara:strand:+ start:110 stop:580 length:471 start_codon:yes stop_codon:yes gene_type:complete